MNSSSNCTAKFLAQDTAAVASLQHLFGASALADLDAGERTRLQSAHWMVKSFAKGATVIDQGADRETVFVLLSGWAFRFQTLAEGKRQILDFIFTGSLSGFGCGRFNSYGVEAVTDCRFACIPSNQFKRLLLLSPSLAMHVAERVSECEMRAHAQITSLGRRSARQRIAAFIIELARQTPGSPDAGTRHSFALPVTQIMIGDALGLSHEHVCRILGKLAGDGMLRFDRHVLEVLDEASLAREAGLDEDGDVLRLSSRAMAA